uniref:Putative terminase n=1 Tax=viral metagenome TaxID=1070528 RepID=A0A6M3IHR6_9ZZZZ
MISQDFNMTDADIDNLVSSLVSRLAPRAIEYLVAGSFTEYQYDPVGFCEKILGDTLTDDVKVMMESVRDNTVTVAISGNDVGKSHAAARIAVWFYLCHPQVKVFTAAAPPLDNLKNILWGEIGTIVQEHQDLFIGNTITTLDLRRGPEDFLTGVTIPSSGTEKEKEARFSGKHRPYMLFVLDEGDAIPDPVYTGIESCMSGGHVRLLIMFNPRQAVGPVYRMIKNKEANVVHLSVFNHPNVVTGQNVIPGAVSRETTVRRVNLWTRPFRNGDKETERSVYTLPDFLVREIAKRQDGTFFPPLQAGKYKILNPSFSYMVLGQYPAQGSDQLISEEWISAARSRYDLYVGKYGETPPVGAHGVMGLDVAEMGDDSNVAVGRYGGYLTSFDTWNGVDPIETGNRAVTWYRRNKGINRANVDATGVGAGVAPHMQRSDGVIATGIKVASKPTTKTEIGEFRILRDELLWRVREWLRTDSGAMLPPDEALIEELTALTYNTDTGYVEVTKTADMKKILGRSPDRLMSLAMTFAGAGGLFQDCEFTAFPGD